MFQEVLDGCDHVRWDVGTSDLTHSQTQTPAYHCRYCGNHPLTRVALLPAAGSDPRGCVVSVLMAKALVGRLSEVC